MIIKGCSRTSMLQEGHLYHLRTYRDVSTEHNALRCYLTQRHRPHVLRNTARSRTALRSEKSDQKQRFPLHMRCLHSKCAQHRGGRFTTRGPNCSTAIANTTHQLLSNHAAATFSPSPTVFSKLSKFHLIRFATLRGFGYCFCNSATLKSSLCSYRTKT